MGQLKNDTFLGRFKAIHCGDNPDTELSVCLQMEVYFITPKTKSITPCVGYVPSTKEWHPFHRHIYISREMLVYWCCLETSANNFLLPCQVLVMNYSRGLRGHTCQQLLQENTTSRCNGTGLKMRAFSSAETVLHSYVNWTARVRDSNSLGVSLTASRELYVQPVSGSL